MAVLQKDAYRRSISVQQNLLFAAHRRYDGSRRVQGRTGRLPVISSGSLSHDILKLAALLLLILFVILLLADLGVLYSGRTTIGKLSARIETLSSSNALLQEDLTLAMNHPVLRSANMDNEEETVIMLTAALP